MTFLGFKHPVENKRVGIEDCILLQKIKYKGRIQLVLPSSALLLAPPETPVSSW